MRAPRTRFAASLVVTLAAAGCGRTVDHREPVHPNPPPVTTTEPTPPTPTPDGRQWSVMVMGDGTCGAMEEIACPEGASCNPPPPAKIACPDHADQIHYTIRSEQDGTCRLVTPTPDCPANVRCNPPAPRSIDCPHD